MIILVFSCFLVILTLGLLRSFKIKNPHKLKYSIMIACRNEEHNLPILLSALQKLDYPNNLYEIIFVDDASTDNSLSFIKIFCTKRPYTSYYHLKTKDEEYKGKKGALKKAIQHAKYDIFLITDADCTPPPNWIESFNNFFSEKTGMVVGFSPDIKTSLFKYFTQIVSATIYSSTIGLGIPFSCAGSNMAIRRSVFDKISGFEKVKHYRAGVDKMLINLVRNHGFQIAYNPLVKVPSIAHIEKNFNQQKRRYGKFALSSTFYKIISIVIFLYYLYLPYAVFVRQELLSFGIYYLCSLLFLLISIIKHKEKFCLPYLFYIFIYPYYLIFFSIWGIFGNWQWKK